LSTAQLSKKTEKMSQQTQYPKALVDYNDFSSLVADVEKHRADHLVSLDVFLKMSKEENVVILDTRSDFRFNRKHLKGAIHLDFTDFTQTNLLKLIPDPNTRILIYCNNNFDGDQVDFASKIARPQNAMETQILSNRKPLMLALNIPTHINLFGYGYRNIYELDELVNVNDKRVVFEGTQVR
jgi:Rhodanese-like domain